MSIFFTLLSPKLWFCYIFCYFYPFPLIVYLISTPIPTFPPYFLSFSSLFATFSPLLAFQLAPAFHLLLGLIPILCILLILSSFSHILVPIAVQLCSGYHCCTTSFNKVWNQVLHRLKSYLRRVGDLRWWDSLTMTTTGNKA